MPTIKTTIDIGASAEVVWRLLTHFSSYPTWNPFIREIHGKPEIGARLKVRVRLSKHRVQRFSSRVVKAMPAMELHWRRKLLLIGGLFDREHALIIVPNGVMGVKFIQKERFTGVLVPVMLPFVAKKTRQGFERMNVALKKLAETKG